jgi:hypothetical protein
MASNIVHVVHKVNPPNEKLALPCLPATHTQVIELCGSNQTGLPPADK